MADILTEAAMENDIATNLLDNTTREITEERMRETFYKINRRTRIVPFAELRVFKRQGNTLATLQVNDIATGFITPTLFIPYAKYLGGAIELPASWEGDINEYT